MSFDNALFALLFFLPAGVANMAPVFTSKLPFIRNWETPMDFGKSYKGVRIFGKNKRWRGLISGIIAGTITGLIIYEPFFADDYSRLTFALIAASMSAGALIGDAVESFFKRQRKIASGQPWFPFDQTDYIIGGLIFVLPFGVLHLWLILWVVGLYFGLHLVSSYIGYLLGLKELPI